MKRGSRLPAQAHAPVTLRKPAAIALLAAPLLVAACTFLVKFDDKKDPDEPDPTGEEDAGRDTGATVVPEAAPPIDAPRKPNPCKGLAEGDNWDPQDRTARCCGGTPVLVSTITACGACGLVCGAGQTCELKSDHYYCTGCVAGGNAVNQACDASTHCCSKQFDTRGLCAASTCVQSGSSCNQIVCPPGATCLIPTGASFVCSYWP